MRPVPIDDDGRILAAEYVRMSTDMQVYSPALQREIIRRYASDHNLRVARSYEDEGRSGLTIEGRPGLRSLIGDIEANRHDFSVLLVYDISRWGRFQDTDESAYYEFICRRAGVLVTYCAEPFENDATPYSSVVKSLKRIMAAEYSRELSDKIYFSQARQTRLGFAQGGSAGFALKRVVVDQAGRRRFELRSGERKGLRSDRIRIEPGDPNEVATVQEIFDLFVEKHWVAREIAQRLNAEGSPVNGAPPWTAPKVYRVLHNERYAGVNIYGRTSRKLKSGWKINPPSQWIRAPGTIPAIITPEVFAKAAARLNQHCTPRTNAEMLADIKRIWESQGGLTGPLIDNDPVARSASSYSARFGSLTQAFALIGYPTESLSFLGQLSTVDIRRACYRRIKVGLERRGYRVTARRVSGILEIGPIAIGVCVSLPIGDADARSWCVQFGRSRPIDLGVIVRVAPGAIRQDHFIVPSTDVDLRSRHFISPPSPLDVYAVEDDDLVSAIVTHIERRRTSNSGRWPPSAVGPANDDALKRISAAQAAWKPAIPKVMDDSTLRGERAEMGKRTRRRSNEDLLQDLRRLEAAKGPLSPLLINADAATAAASTYANRFGSCANAIALASVSADQNSGPIPFNVRPARQALARRIAKGLASLGVHAKPRRSGMMDIDGLGLAVCVTAAEQRDGREVWRVEFGKASPTHIGVIARVDVAGRPLDYLLVPGPKVQLTRRYYLRWDAAPFEEFKTPSRRLVGDIRRELERQKRSDLRAAQTPSGGPAVDAP